MTVTRRKSVYLTTVATLAAVHIVLSYLPPPVGFRRISIVMEPLEGIIAGPYLGFIAATLGWVGGRFIRPDSFWIENVFGIAEAVGALGAGFLVTRKWYLVGGLYGIQLAAFLLHPIARHVPLWTLWDIYLGFLAIPVAAFLVGRMRHHEQDTLRLALAVAVVSFVTVELDAMVRVFMLTVMGLYQMYPIPMAMLPLLFLAGAIQTPIEAAYGVATSVVVGVPALIALRKSHLVDWPLHSRLSRFLD